MGHAASAAAAVRERLRGAAQVAFLTLVFGGCQQYLAPSLARAHAHLIREQGLTVEHFDMVLEHLGDALEELDAALHELAEPSVRPRPCSPAAQGSCCMHALCPPRAGKALTRTNPGLACAQVHQSHPDIQQC